MLRGDVQDIEELKLSRLTRRVTCSPFKQIIGCIALRRARVL